MSFLIPAAIGVASGIGGLFGGNAQQRAAQERARLYNDWLSKRDTATGDIIDQTRARGYDLYGPQVRTSRQSGTSHTSSTPTITSQYQPVESSLRRIVQGRLDNPSSLPAGYAENAVRAINESSAGANQAAINQAARMGLSGQQTYALASPTQTARAGQIANLRTQMPLLERNLQNEDIGLAQALTSAFGRGEDSTTNYSNYGETTAPPDIQALMALLLGPGPQAGQETGYSPWGAGLNAASQAGSGAYQSWLANR